MGVRCARGWWFSRDHQLTWVLSFECGLSRHARRIGSPSLTETRRRTREFHRSVFLTASLPGNYMGWVAPPRTCPPRRMDSTRAPSAPSRRSSCSPPSSAVQENKDNEESPYSQSKVPYPNQPPQNRAAPHHRVARIRLPHFLVPEWIGPRSDGVQGSPEQCST